DRPIRQLASTDDLLGVLEVLRSPWKTLARRFSIGGGGMTVFGGIVSTNGSDLFGWTGAVEALVRYGAPVVFLFVLLHLPFAARRERVPASARVERALSILGSLLDPLLPGSWWLARRRTLTGAALLLAVPLLCLTVWMARHGA